MHLRWDDFKFLSAVIKQGKVRAAAKELGVHPSTVTRRIEQFERRLGVKLFNRRGQALAPTSVGAAAAVDLMRVEQELFAIERSIKHSEQELAGWVRLAAPEYFALAGLFEEPFGWPRDHADIRIEWTTMGSASAPPDVAVHPTAEPPLDMVGRQVGFVGWSLYCSRRLRLAADSAPGWIGAAGLGHEDSLTAAVATLHLRHLPDVPTLVSCQGWAQLLCSVQSGFGAAALPCLLGDRDPSLQRLPGATVVREPLWLLMAPESRGVRRVRALMEFMHGMARARAGDISGETPALPEAREGRRGGTSQETLR